MITEEEDDKIALQYEAKKVVEIEDWFHHGSITACCFLTGKGTDVCLHDLALGV